MIAANVALVKCHQQAGAQTRILTQSSPLAIITLLSAARLTRGRMLSFNVAQLLKEGLGAFRHYALSGELFAIDAENPGPVLVDGDLHLVRTPRGILAQGWVQAGLRQACRRCLALSETHVRLEIEEEFIPSVDIETGASLPITDEDEAELVINEHHLLDLTEVLRQLAVAAVVNPGLCREDCRGLCPVCGANLNSETCTCQKQIGDPRLAVLAQWFGSREDS